MTGLTPSGPPPRSPECQECGRAVTCPPGGDLWEVSAGMPQTGEVGAGHGDACTGPFSLSLPPCHSPPPTDLGRSWWCAHNSGDLLGR